MERRSRRTRAEIAALVVLALALVALPAVGIYAYVSDADERAPVAAASIPPVQAASLTDLDRALDQAERASRRRTKVRRTPQVPAYRPRAQVGFRWPVASGYVTSPFGFRRIDGDREFHHGADLRCGVGDGVYASAPGYIVAAGTNPVYGNVVLVQHTNGWQTLYGHLSEIVAAPTQVLETGTVIGLCGDTGRATGPHLHFEIRYGGYVYDPLEYLG